MTKQSQLRVGQTYLAKVSGRMVTVSLDSIDSLIIRGKTRKMYYVANLRTGRKLVFKSCTKFRSVVHNCEKCQKPIITQPIDYQPTTPILCGACS